MQESYRLSDIDVSVKKGLGVIVSAFVLREKGKDKRIYREDGCWSVENRCDCNIECSCDKECRHCRCVDNCPCNPHCNCEGYEPSCDCEEFYCNRHCDSYEPAQT